MLDYVPTLAENGSKLAIFGLSWNVIKHNSKTKIGINKKMPEFLEYIVGIIHTKFQLSISSSFSGKNSNFILRYGRFSEKRPQNMKNVNFFQFYSMQVSETLFSHSFTPNISFYQVSSDFMQYFSFYGSKTLSKWPFFDPKTPKILIRKSR